MEPINLAPDEARLILNLRALKKITRFGELSVILHEGVVKRVKISLSKQLDGSDDDVLGMNG